MCPGCATVVLAVLLAVVPGTAVAGTIRISGTGGAIGTMRILGQAFQKVSPDTRVVVTPSIGTAGAIKAVIEGGLDVGLSSRPANSGECDRGCMSKVYAKTPFVFGVNQGVTATGLTLSEVADIYAGKRDRWENGSRIRPVLRPPGESDLGRLKAMSPGMKAAVESAMRRPGMIVAMTDQDTADVIEKTPGAFGGVTLALVISENRAIRVLKLNGIAPTAQALADGSYPYAKTFHMITKRDSPPRVRQFVDFVLSPAGTAILSKNGQVAVQNGRGRP